MIMKVEFWGTFWFSLIQCQGTEMSWFIEKTDSSFTKLCLCPNILAVKDGFEIEMRW